MFTLIENYTGPMAGVATSLLWTVTSLFFAAAAYRLGTTVVNSTRILFAILLLGATHLLTTGSLFPEATTEQVVYLALSGVIGLSIGDQALFTAFVYIGPRMAMLIMTASPLMAALFGWMVLGESLHVYAWCGMTMTLGGIAWVVMERPEKQLHVDPGHRWAGILLALVGAACQAGGLLLSKQGMGHGVVDEAHRMSPQAATFVRMSFAGLGMIPFLAVYAQRERKRRAAGLLRKRRGSPRAGLIFTLSGAVTGPFLGVWMSLVAADRSPLGVAQTLCSMAPIFLLPTVYFLHKERLSLRAIIGAVIAVAGSTLLFIQPG